MGVTLQTFAEDLEFVDVFIGFEHGGIRLEIRFVDIEITAIVILVIVVVESITGHFVIRNLKIEKQLNKTSSSEHVAHPYFSFELLKKVVLVLDILVFTIVDFYSEENGRIHMHSSFSSPPYRWQQNHHRRNRCHRRCRRPRCVGRF